MRKEFKSIEMSISYTKSSRNCKMDVTQKAEIKFSIETMFSSIERFVEDVKKIIIAYKYCAQSGTYCRIYLSASQYENAESHETLKQKLFNSWYFDGVPSVDDEGIYLSPDLKYTDETKDIYISYNDSLLTQLAQANI